MFMGVATIPTRNERRKRFNLFLIFSLVAQGRPFTARRHLEYDFSLSKPFLSQALRSVVKGEALLHHYSSIGPPSRTESDQRRVAASR